MADRDLLIFGGLGLLALYLLNSRGQQAATTGTAGVAATESGCSIGGVDMCAARKVSTESPSSVPTNSFCEGGQVLREGVCINPTSGTARIGGAVNDATLAMLIREQEKYMAIGDWESAWQISYKRDAWIKQQGY